MKWERTGVEVRGNGEKTITYKSPQLPGVRVESQRINIPHANGNGHRQATRYVAIFENDGLQVDCKSLKEAKQCAEDRKS